jgi:HK97 family phage prohead protease
MNKFGVSTLDGPSVIKDIDAKKGIVVSYPSTFDVVDSGRERVKRGAFNRTINAWGPEGKKRTKVLFNHEPWSIIGRPVVLREDAYGLYAESQIVPTRLGADVLMLIENEVITEQSIGFTPVRTEKNDDDNTLDILEVKLYEYSFLAWGMNAETPIIGVKGEDAVSRMLTDMKRVERVLKSGEFHTDDVPEMLTRVLTQWQEDLGTMTKNAEEKLLTLNVADEAGIRKAISELQSLLPSDSPSGTPKNEDSVESEADSNDNHSEALTRFLEKVSDLNQREDAERTALKMLREFQTKLGC